MDSVLAQKKGQKSHKGTLPKTQKAAVDKSNRCWSKLKNAGSAVAKREQDLEKACVSQHYTSLHGTLCLDRFNWKKTYAM